MKQIDRRALFASGAAAALLAATGVSATPKRGGTLRAALAGATRADGWDLPGGTFMQAAQMTLFEALTEIAADGTLRGEIATDWRRDETARVWEFQLRDTVFHDGAPLQAADIEMALSPLGLVDMGTACFRLVLDEADPNLPFRLAAPEYLIRPADPARRAAGVGSGLYSLRKFDPGRHLIADRVDSHWKSDAGWFDVVDFVHFGDPEVRAQALREGLVDVADIETLHADEAGFTRLPDQGHTMQIVSHDIALPAQTGRAFPLDNLRMAERWWRA